MPNVAELVVKAIGHQNWTRQAINGEPGPPTYPAIEPDRWGKSFDESTTDMLATLADAGAMERTVALAAGLSPAQTGTGRKDTEAACST